MKVKTLIARLSKMNPEAKVRLGHLTGDEALFLNACTNDKDTVWLEGESDIDLSAEIRERFDRALECMDELDFYMDLLEIGIDAERVRKYMGDECANHMIQFCEEHGLV